jgi:hypothetical protein
MAVLAPAVGQINGSEVRKAAADLETAAKTRLLMFKAAGYDPKPEEILQVSNNGKGCDQAKALASWLANGVPTDAAKQMAAWTADELKGVSEIAAGKVDHD